VRRSAIEHPRPIALNDMLQPPPATLAEALQRAETHNRLLKAELARVRATMADALIAMSEISVVALEATATDNLTEK
jgi:hypothetical protein